MKEYKNILKIECIKEAIQNILKVKVPQRKYKETFKEFRYRRMQEARRDIWKDFIRDELCQRGIQASIRDLIIEGMKTKRKYINEYDKNNSNSVLCVQGSCQS